MANEVLKAGGVRLYPALWARIHREAKAAKLRPGDFLRRRIESAFDFDPEVQEILENEHQ